jgi:hypothetical protein
MTRINRKYKKRKTLKRQKGGCGCAMRGGKRRKRKNTKKYEKKRRRRKTRKSRKRHKSRRKRKRQRGGNLLVSPKNSGLSCNYSGNPGAFFGNKLRENPFLPDSVNTNTNMKGGGFLQDFGLGDIQLNFWKAQDIGPNSLHRYKGGKQNVSSDPMVQNLKGKTHVFNHNDIASIHQSSSNNAASI